MAIQAEVLREVPISDVSSNKELH